MDKIDLITNLTIRATGFHSNDGKAWCELLNDYVNCIIDDDASFSFARDCVEYFNSFDAKFMNKIYDIADICLEEWRSSVDEPGPMPVINERRDVLGNTMRIEVPCPNPKAPDMPAIKVIHYPEWEQEHGILWIARNDELVYFGINSPEDPWKSFKKPDSWNYAFRV